MHIKICQKIIMHDVKSSCILIQSLFEFDGVFVYENNLILKRYGEHGETCSQYVSPLPLPWLCYVCLSNTGLILLRPQIAEDDDQVSSSEGSTIDGLPGGEGVESVDFESEEFAEPDACFPDSKYYYNHHFTQHCYAYTQY